MNDDGDGVRLEYCDEWHDVDAATPFRVGRTGDLSLDDNPYLHRHFLELRRDGGVWVLANVGSQLSATVGDEHGHFVAHLSPGGVLPLAFEQTFVRFGAGPTTYEFRIELPSAPFGPADAADRDDELIDDGLGTTTKAPAALTPDQRLVVLALAEPAMQRTGSGPSALPPSGVAAKRLGWTEKKFNKKLDQVCQKLSRAGVPGLHGAPGELASNRRGRLVEYCLATRMVTPNHLVELDQRDDVED